MQTSYSLLLPPQKPWTEKLELLSGWCAVAIAFCLPISTTFTDVFFVAAVVFSLLAGNWQQKIFAITHTRLTVVFLLFFLMFLLGTLYSIVPHATALKMASKYDKFLWGAFLLPIFIEERWRRYAIYAFVAAMIITLIASYAKFALRLNWNIYFGIASVFKDHIQTNFLMAFMTYLTAWLAIKHPRYRWYFIALIIPLVINTLFMSQGRSGYIIFLGLMALLLWQTLRWRGLLVAILAAVILSIFAYFASSSFQLRANEVVRDTQSYVQGNPFSSVGRRLTYTHNSVELIKQHPIIGTGTGSFTYAYANLKPTPAILTDNPHNEYLNIAVQFGLVGLALLIFMFYVHGRDSFKLPRDMQWLTQAVLLAIALGSFANSWLMDTTEGHFYTFFAALTFASLWEYRRSPNEQK